MMAPAAAERFWAHGVPMPDGCLIWPNDTGHYARVCIDDKTVGCHVVAYVLAHGALPEGHEVHHVCERLACILPEHLQAVTHSEHRKTHLRTRWEFFLRRPGSVHDAPAHFGVVNFLTRESAERNARRWQRLYPDFTRCELRRYEVDTAGERRGEAVSAVDLRVHVRQSA